MMFHYRGCVLGAIRYEGFKIYIKEGCGGLPGMDFYNVMRDPGEKYGRLYPGLFAVTPVNLRTRPGIGRSFVWPTSGSFHLSLRVELSQLDPCTGYSELPVAILQRVAKQLRRVLKAP